MSAKILFQVQFSKRKKLYKILNVANELFKKVVPIFNDNLTKCECSNSFICEPRFLAPIHIKYKEFW